MMTLNVLLPVGSVVLLKEAEKKLIILGYLRYGIDNESVIYDYVGCTYPEGFITPELLFAFNHVDIETVYFLGYQNQEQKVFEQKIMKIYWDLKGGD